MKPFFLFFVLPFIGFTVQLVVTGMVFLALLPGDIPEFDDSDMLPAPITIAPQENAFTFYEEAALLFVEAERKGWARSITQDNIWDEVMVQARIETNQPAFAQVKLGNQKQHCFPRPMESYIDHAGFNGLRLNFMRLYAFRVEWHFRRQEETRALEVLEEFVRFCVQCREHPISENYFMMVSAGLGLAYGNAEDMIYGGRLNEKKLAQLQTILASVPGSAPTYARAIKQEYRLVKGLFKDFDEDPELLMEWMGVTTPFKGTQIPGKLFHRQRSTKAVYRHCREVAAHAHLPLAEFEEGSGDAEMLAFVKDLTSYNVFAQRRLINPVGYVLAYTMMSSSGHGYKRVYQQRFIQRGLVILTALHRYHRAEGRWPETLEELVPVYLASLPEDPYDGNPFRYDHARGLLYSVGENLTDEGGADAQPKDHPRYRPGWDEDADDYVFPLIWP